MMATTFVPIQSVTLASSAASVTFSSIPQTFTDLVVRCSVRSTRAAATTDYALMYFNAATSGYSGTWILGYGTGAISARNSNNSRIWGGEINAASSTADTFTSVEWTIPNYAGTTQKPISAIFAEENNSSEAYLYGVANLANVTTGITSVTIETYTFYSAAFTAGSTFHLYGIKNS